MADEETREELSATWKTRLYQTYVSSGQATAGANARSDYGNLLRTRRPYLRSVIRDHLPKDRSIAIADLACGYGALVSALHSEGYAGAFGVDISREQVELASQLGVHSVTAAPILEFLQGAAGDSLDIVFVMDVLEHMTRNELLAHIEEIHRVLKRGGKCIAHVPNAGGLFGMRVRYGDLTHELAFTDNSARQIFGSVGFRATAAVEDKPVVHGITSLGRRVVWECLTTPLRLLFSAETGKRGAILSQNMILVATK